MYVRSSIGSTNEQKKNRSLPIGGQLQENLTQHQIKNADIDLKILVWYAVMQMAKGYAVQWPCLTLESGTDDKNRDNDATIVLCLVLIYCGWKSFLLYLKEILLREVQLHLYTRRI